MGDTSRLTDPPDTCVPSTGVGVPTDADAEVLNQDHDRRRVVNRINPAEQIANSVVKELAASVARVLMGDAAESLCRITGLTRIEMSWILEEVARQFFVVGSAVPPAAK